MPLLWSVILLTGCGSSEGVQAEQAAEVAEARAEADVARFGWISEVVLAPERFTELTATGKDGWIALHAHDYPGAISAFTEQDLPRARAELALGLLYDDLARLSGLVNNQLYTEWEQRADLPEGNAAPLMAALSSHCADGDTTAIWAGRVKEGPGFGVARALVQGRSPFDVQGNDPVVERMGQHRSARRGEVDRLTAEAQHPLMTIDEDEEFRREFWDPCVYRSLSDGWFIRASGSLGGTNWRSMERFSDPIGAEHAPLAGRIFAPWPTADDLSTEMSTATGPGTVGAHSPTLRKLGLGTNTSASDDADTAREEVRLLDVGLDGWRAELVADATDEGRGLLEDLGLLERFRQEWLVTRARAALESDHPQQALAYLELARDVSTREIGPRNSPALVALMAEAHLRLGHTREALDPLQLLTVAHPETIGLRETLGDLAVLRGVDRNGDSKEAQ